MKELVKSEAAKPIDSKDNKLGLTKDEQLVIDKLMECMKAFMALEFQHPEDNREFCYAVHLIQGLLTMRTARRQYPDGWVTYGMKKINGKNRCVVEKESNGLDE